VLQIGDTWIHGIASDAGKVADYRAMQRMRRKLSYDHSQDPAYRNLSRFLLKVRTSSQHPDTDVEMSNNGGDHAALEQA
jgi:hypothetical protein